jgi:hypothetical protein
MFFMMGWTCLSSGCVGTRRVDDRGKGACYDGLDMSYYGLIFLNTGQNFTPMGVQSRTPMSGESQTPASRGQVPADSRTALTWRLASLDQKRVIKGLIRLANYYRLRRSSTVKNKNDTTLL